MTSVKVAVRVRPLNQREDGLDSKFIIQMDGKKTTITNLKIPESMHEGDTAREAMRQKDFTFDFSFWSVLKTDPKYASQEKVFQCLGVDVVNSAYDGYNACVFAYGQTGSGKSYTMMGGHDDPGLIPRICKELFSKMSDEETNYRTEVSYLEIYNEKVRDLLKNHSAHKAMHSLRVREHPKHGPYVQDLSKHIVNNYQDIKELMNRGNAIRTTAATNMNDVSSRSHAIFTIVFTQAKFTDDMPCETSSKIHLVDLAGSERADASGATGQRLKEGASINKSLVTLGTVISVLAEASGNRPGKNSFIPYRDSVLTWLLKDSLGGNSRTIMIATISPADVNYAETLSTLRYANRAKNIINRPTVNEDPNVKLIRELREEIARLKAMLGGNIDNISTPKVQEKLHENEARVKVLTQEWAGKWNETEHILKDPSLALRKEGLGVVLDSNLPHLIGIDDDILSTGIMLYHLKEGKTTVGRTDADIPPDIVISGLDTEEEHCVIEYSNGEVTLYPIQSSLCVINGATVIHPTKLTQGAVILLGKTNMFRFNHPAEAAKMKQEMKHLSLSRTSLLSKSMSDLYMSTDNLPLATAGFELEKAHSAEMEKIEEKRRQIEIMEKRYLKAEKDREKQQQSLEKELEEKEYRLELLNIELEKGDIHELLRRLDQKEADLRNEAADAIEKLYSQIRGVQEGAESKRRELEEQISSLADKDKTLKAMMNQEEGHIIEEKAKLEEEKAKELEKVHNMKGDLQKVILDFETKKQKVIGEDDVLRGKFEELEKEMQEVRRGYQRTEEECKARWNIDLEEITQENQNIEEAWRDLNDQQNNITSALNKEDLTEEDRLKLQQDQDELEQARALLKLEEEHVSKKEKQLLDNIEREMDDLESRKESALDDIKLQKNKLLEETDKDLCKMNKVITSRESEISAVENIVEKHEHEIVNLNTKLKTLSDSNTSEIENLTKKRNSLVLESENFEADIEKSTSQLNYQVEEVQSNLQKELAKLQEERERLLGSRAQGSSTETEADDIQDDELRKKTQEIHDLRQKLEATQQQLEDKWKEFDEQRDSELDRIEFERLKLQEVEHQARINALVEQEVKRRMFEEKAHRESKRKQEREKEKRERDLEIQKLKEQHSREIKNLKAKYEKEKQDSAMKTVASTRSNPYGTTISSSLSGSLFGGESCTLGVSIPSFRLQGYGSDAHYEYEVKMAVGEDAWTIFRRYSRFRQMHQELKKKMPEVSALVFPPRKLFSRSEKVVVERRRQLELYLKNLLAIFLRCPQCPLHPSQNKYLSKQVLCDFETFFKRGLFEVTKHGTT
ncbi:hypothetical protein FSP39_012500 [Pinctada imbricata]|uniref:Kinesin-like protein KIF16B n=1 Tax=Pinctada imbricata TaxID=66713 RepID=A0AA88XVF5_PINIB|nr:hypothetical protein FSP39_012500 [Pinctada imbricata]